MCSWFRSNSFTEKNLNHKLDLKPQCQNPSESDHFRRSLVPYKKHCIKMSSFHVLMPLFVEWKSLVTSKGPRNDSAMEDEEMAIDFFWPLHGGVWLPGTQFPLQKGLSGVELWLAIVLCFCGASLVVLDVKCSPHGGGRNSTSGESEAGEDARCWFEPLQMLSASRANASKPALRISRFGT